MITQTTPQVKLTQASLSLPQFLIDQHAFFGTNILANVHTTIDDFVQIQEAYRPRDLKFIIIAASPKENDRVAEVVQEHRDLFLGAQLLVVPRKDLPWPYTSPKEIEAQIASPSVVGLKVVTSLVDTPIDDPALGNYATIAESAKKPFLIHCCSKGEKYTSPERNRRFVEAHPLLKTVLAHFGGLRAEYMAAAIKLSQEFPNVYLNTAGMAGWMRTHKRTDSGIEVQSEFHQSLYELCLDHISRVSLHPQLCTRIIAGTDYPIEPQHTFAPLDKLQKESREQIMNNAAQLYFGKPIESLFSPV